VDKRASSPVDKGIAMGAILLLAGVAIGLLWMFWVPAYIGWSGGAWWGAAVWGFIAGPLCRPIILYNRARSSWRDGAFPTFLVFLAVGALPFVAMCLAVYWAAEKWL
jgi:hypothetical protein